MYYMIPHIWAKFCDVSHIDFCASSKCSWDDNVPDATMTGDMALNNNIILLLRWKYACWVDV